MLTVNSLSGGQTSSYIAANFPADYQLFSLVRIEDKKCKFPDAKIRREVEDRIQAPFISTAEDDMIIYTMLDLEQHIGQKINWVTGITFDEVIRSKGGWLPNKLHRYCTTHMKLIPMFHWWYKNINTPVEMRIGYRANEQNRAMKMLNKLNGKGLLEIKETVSKHPSGRNKWQVFEWQKPVFPLITDNIFKDTIVNYWHDKNVRFAELNNCVGCMHRSPILLRKEFDWNPQKMAWFKNKEGGRNGFWRSDMSYADIEKHHLQHELTFTDFSECDSGYCSI